MERFQVGTPLTTVYLLALLSDALREIVPLELASLEVASLEVPEPLASSKVALLEGVGVAAGGVVSWDRLATGRGGNGLLTLCLGGECGGVAGLKSSLSTAAANSASCPFIICTWFAHWQGRYCG